MIDILYGTAKSVPVQYKQIYNDYKKRLLEIKKRMIRPINAPNVLDIIARPNAKSPLPL